MKVVRRTRPGTEDAVTRVVEEGTTPPAGPPLEPAPDRDLWPWLLLLLVLVIGGIVAAILLTRDDKTKNANPSTTQPATTVTVARATPTAPTTTAPKAPAVARVKLASLLGIPASTAVARLRKDGLEPAVSSVFSTKPRGTVAAQMPGPGTQLAKGATVTLMVSKGQQSKPVPDVVGQSESQAVALLKAAGFGGAPVDVPSSETKGNVVAQKPKAGENAQPGTKVRLNVSSGPASSGSSSTPAPTTTAPTTTAPAATSPARTAPSRPAQPVTVTIPDVEGNSLEQAQRALRGVGVIMEIRYVPNDQPSGTVVAQARKPGMTAKRGDHMLVTVSQGGSGGTAASPLVTVPNVVGQDEQTAQTRLQQAGFAAIVEDMATNDSTEDGNVVDEQPAAGTKAPKGSQVIIYVGRASTG
jgi:beta-lactam-binding protein with PASTA domain